VATVGEGVSDLAAVATVGEGVSGDFNLGWITIEFGCFALSLHYSPAKFYAGKFEKE
jgi:hypothetical protein